MVELNPEQQALVAQGLPYSETWEQQQASIQAELTATYDPLVAELAIDPMLRVSMQEGEAEQFLRTHPVEAKQAQAELESRGKIIITTPTGQEINLIHGVSEVVIDNNPFQISYDELGIPSISGLPFGNVVRTEGGLVPIGESYVSRDILKTMSPEDISKLKELGIEGYNASLESEEYIPQEIRENYVRLDNGELVSNTDFNVLPPEQQQFLRVKGVDAFVAEYNKPIDKDTTYLLTEYVRKVGGEPAVTYLNQLQEMDTNTLANTGIAGTAVQEYLKGLEVGQESDIAEIQMQPNFNKLSQSAQMFLLSSDMGDYYKLETPEEKFQWLLDNNIIVKGSTYADEVDENGNPMIFPPTSEEQLAQMRDEAYLPEGYINWLNTPMPLFGGKVTYGELVQQKLFGEYGSPSANQSVVLMPEAGGKDWNIEAVNRAFQYIPFEKKVFFDVPESIQQKMTTENIRAGVGTVGWSKLIDIQATWNNLSDNEKALVLLNYNATPTGLEQAIDVAHIPILYTVKNWDSLSTLEKVFSVANDILLLAPMFSPITRPLSALASRAIMATSIGERATNIVSNIGRDIALAMRSGDATRLAGAGTKLRVLGEELVSEGIPEARYMAEAGRVIEGKAPYLSQYQKETITAINKLEGKELDDALTLAYSQSGILKPEPIGEANFSTMTPKEYVQRNRLGLIKDSPEAQQFYSNNKEAIDSELVRVLDGEGGSNVIGQADRAIDRANVRISSDIDTNISEINNIIEVLEVATNNADKIATQTAIRKLNEVTNKLAPFADEVRGYEEIIGLNRIVERELRESGILSKATIARIKSIRLQRGLRSPLTAMGLKIQSPLELTGELSHLQWPFKQDFPFIRSLRQTPVGGEWAVGGKVAEYEMPVVRFRNPIVRTESLVQEGKLVEPVISTPKRPTMDDINNYKLFPWHEDEYGIPYRFKDITPEEYLKRWQATWDETWGSSIGKARVGIELEAKPLLYTKGVSTYVTRRGFAPNVILDQYGRPLTWPDGSYIMRGEFPIPRIKSPYPDKTIIGYGKTLGTLEDVPRYKITVGDIRMEIETTGIQGAIDRWGKDVVIKYFPVVKQIINDPQFILLAELRNKQWAEAFEKGRAFKETQISNAVEEAIQRKYIMKYNEDDYVTIWDRIESEVDKYLGVTDENYRFLTEPQRNAREALIRSKMSEYMDGSPMIDTGTYETVLERSGLMEQIPYRESMNRWWPTPTEARGFDPYIMPFGEPTTPISPIQPSRLSLVGGMILGLNPTAGTTVFDASILTQNQIDTLISNGATYNEAVQTMSVPYNIKVESPEDFSSRIEPLSTSMVLSYPITQEEQIAMAMIAPSIITRPIPTPKVSVMQQIAPMTEPIPIPQPLPQPIPMPKPISEPLPTPEPIPEPTPIPEPIPIPEAIPTPIPMPLPIPIPTPIPETTPQIKIIKKPFGTGGKPLTKEQLKGAIGWKQGIMYKYIYPPYEQDNIINSRYPIQGIPIKEGIRSAYETIIRTRKGTIPPNITRHMGMMDIQITDADKNGQPEIHFIEQEHRKKRGAVAKKPTPQVFNIKA